MRRENKDTGVGPSEDLMTELVGNVDYMVGDDGDYEDEISGDQYDMVGGPSRDIVGAGPGGVPPGRQKMMRGPENFLWRRQALGLTSAAPIAAGDTGQIIAKPQRDFKVKRLLVSSDVAFFFDIADQKVGQNSQNVGTGVIPASAFTEDAVSVFQDWDTANVGNEIILFVENIDVADHVFRGAAIGLVAVAQY